MPNFVRVACGWYVAAYLLLMLWAVGAPIVADSRWEAPRAPHICPWRRTLHGVGSDLKTFAKEVDRCSNVQPN